MANYKVAYGSKDRIKAAISTGVIPPGTIILTDDSSEILFYNLDDKLSTYTEKYKFESLEEAQTWVAKYDCKGQILSIHEGDKCNIYIVNYDNTLVPITTTKYMKIDRDPTEDDYEYNLLTHWINSASYEVFILVNVEDGKAVWQPTSSEGGGVDFTTDNTLDLDPVTGVLSVNTTDKVEQDNTLPITSAAVYSTLGNIGILLKTI